jgi:multisubunit Na+/H+ antiporter MnhB subunit
VRQAESPILTTIVQVSLYVTKLLAVWIFFRGHQEPGGGFIAGVVVVGAVAVQGLAFGARSAHSVLPVRPWTLLGLGLIAGLTTIVGPMLVGLPFMTHFHGHIHVPFLGDAEWATAAVFDLGVFLIVVGAGKAILLRLAAAKADEGQAQEEIQAVRAREEGV